MNREARGPRQLANRVRPYKLLKANPPVEIPIVCASCSGVVHLTPLEVRMGSEVSCKQCGKPLRAVSAATLFPIPIDTLRVRAAGTLSEFPS